MAILVVAEHDNTNLSDATNKTVTAALKIGGDVDVLIAGENAGDVAVKAAKIDGVRAVLHADGPTLAKQLAEAMQALIVPLMGDYDAVLAPATTNGKNFLPRVAAALDVMQISEIVSRSPGHVCAAHLCGQCHANGQIHRQDQSHHRAPHRL